MARRIELISGFLAGPVGLAVLAYAVFVPFGPHCTYVQDCVAGPHSLWHDGLTPAMMMFFIGIGLLYIAVPACVFAHDRSGDRLALVLLWILSALLFTATGLLFLSIGPFFALPILLTVIAGVAGNASQTSSDGPLPMYSA